ncbi:MAG: pyrrolo-quinoline quinone [Bacillati bacterium ANGP1]|uniref:Pyrrolo-quinoline quinone n=1 Tax=Candidatus Segetimicrobium genomatis TaxID=2569760 RepID=A0A537LTF2_9BACT|nr:MAG: pyrrolo-quinoline quinone [Terrabacteria group bacterium ANGP1]
MFTYHNDLARTGQNLNETILTPGTVTSTTFGKLFADPVDEQIYAQPLYVANVAIPDQGIHNVVYVATENDTVYALDADAPGAPLWQTSLLVEGGTAVPISDLDPTCTDLVPVIGVTGTPVIDPTTNTLYVVAKTKEGPSDIPAYVQRLHALDIATGAEKFGGPVTIAATVPGTGDGGKRTTLTFNPLLQLNRPGLALVNGVVYIAFGSHCDIDPFHGWLFGYDAGLLTQVGVFVTTPNGRGGSIWQGGGSVAADAGNNLYVMTGNGTFDAYLPGAMDFGDSVLKLFPTLTLADYFTPFDQDYLEAIDLDLGSGAPMVLPDQAGAVPHLLVGAGKEGTIYLLDRDNLGQFCGCSGDGQIVQSIPFALGIHFGTPAVWNNLVYFLAAFDVLKAFSISKGHLSTSPASQGTTAFGFPGATVSVSANGATDGIVWAVETHAYAKHGPAVLHAYDATDVGTELYNSTQADGGRDTLGPAVKFAVPTVVNGKVYVGTANELDVFGVLP